MKDTQQFLVCNKFLNPTGQTSPNLLIVPFPQKPNGPLFYLLLGSARQLHVPIVK